MVDEDAVWRDPPVVRYRRADGVFAESTLDRVSVELLIDGLPVRDFRWYRGRRFYSGWH